MKKLMLLLAIVVAMSVGAQAATVACSGITTWGGAIGIGAGNDCQFEDKLFSNFANLAGGSITTTVPNNWTTEFSSFTLAGLDYHDFNVSRGTTGTAIPTTAVVGIGYNVAMVGTPEYLWKFIVGAKVAADITVVGSATVTKNIWTDSSKTTLLATLITSGGSVTSAITKQKSIYVEETISLTNANLKSFTDTFTQATIPEPGTSALMGLGLVGLGFLARRFKK